MKCPHYPLFAGCVGSKKARPIPHTNPRAQIPMVNVDNPPMTPTPTTILGIETSGRAGAIALCRHGECLEERPLQQAGRRHAQTLVSEVQSLFTAHNVPIPECRRVAVSIGPGSFTGLRVGVVFAKTFAYATGCQLAAVDTFLSIAEGSPADISNVFVIEDAQRGELFTARYVRQDGGSWNQESPIDIQNAEAWCAALTSDDTVTGPGLARVEQKLTGVCRVLDPDFRKPSAAIIARIGNRQIDVGETSDAWTLEPFYLRKSAAEEKWDAAGR